MMVHLTRQAHAVLKRAPCG